MLVKDLIKKLSDFNPNAAVLVVAHDTLQTFSIGFGHQGDASEDAKCTPENCSIVTISCDKTNTKEHPNSLNEGVG